jgi:hypothetical protein
MAKINYYDFVGTEECRRFLMGIYHENGLKVMTDSRILLAVKENYSPELEGVILSKDAEKIEGKYPNWKKVVPDMGNYKEITFNLTEDKYKEIKSLVDLQRKINGTKKHKGELLKDAFYKIADNCFINFEYLKQIFQVVTNYKVKVYIDKDTPNNKAVVFKTDDDSCLFLIMPLFNADIEGLNELEGIYFPKLHDACFKTEDPDSDMMTDGRLCSALYRINKEIIFNKLKNNLPLNKSEEVTLHNVKILLENYAK